MELPAKIGPYRILAPLGVGGMGVVYRGEHVESGRQRAVKTVRVPYGSELAGLRCEIHALTRIRHPGIVQIVGEGLENGLPWYAMELLEGRTLEDYHRSLWSRTRLEDPTPSPTPSIDANETIEAPPSDPEVWAQATVSGSRQLADVPSFVNEPTLPARARKKAAAGRLTESLTLLCKLCGPLAFLHRSGIVHRDLKPPNVFIRGDGTPVLMDFGLVSRERTGGREVIEVAGDIMGTTSYMSPEQIKGLLVDARSDLYSLGCILYETVTGRVPFHGEPFQVMLQHVSRPPIPPSKLVDGVPPELEALILRLLSKEPRGRLGHADDVAAILGELTGSEREPAPESVARDYLYRPELVGRQDVLAEFSHKVLACKRGVGSRAFVGGESGVGKTCLAAAVARDARLRELRVVTGECMPLATPDGGPGEMRGAPLHPFRRLFETIADWCRENGPEAAGRVLGARGKLLAAYEPSLATVDGVAQHPDPPEVPAQAARTRLLDALGQSLAAFAREKPVLLILDDLQWADELSLTFLQSLDEAFFAERPILILGTYRSEEVGDALREVLSLPGVSNVELGRLDEKTVGLIVGDMLAMAPPPPALVSVLARKSAGNPFFVAEYLRTAVAERLLYRERGTWRVTGAGEATEAIYEALPLPGSLRELVGRRLDGLLASSRSLVEVAAVLGREVDGDVLVAVAGIVEEEALVAVKELLARQVLEEVRAGRFRFVHDKLREIAYERVPDGRRRELHRQAALTIERRYADSTGFPLLYSELAHHFTEAGDREKAIDYLEKAGEQAQRSFANREAVRFFTEALALDDQAGTHAAPLRRAGWERQLGHAYFLLGRLVDSQAHLHRAVALLGYPMPQSAWRLGLGLVRQALRQLLHRLWPPRTRGSLARRAVLLEATRCYDLLMPVSYFATGQVLRILYATLSNLNLAELAGAPPELALAYANAHVTAGLLPWFSLAEGYGRRAHHTLESVSDPAVRSWVYVLTGSYKTGIGAWDEARALGDRAEAIAREVGFRRRREEALGVLGAVYNLSGNFRRALEVSDLIYESAQRGDPQTQMWALASVALNALPAGEPDRALQAGERAQRILTEYVSEQVGRPEKILAHGTFGLACLRKGDRARARAAAERGAEAIAQGSPMAFYCISSYSCVAETFLELWRTAEPSERASLERLARRSVKHVKQSAKVFPCHRPRAFLFQGRSDALRGRTARALKWLGRSLEAAHALQMPYDEGLAELALAELLDGADPDRKRRLERARELFTTAGAVYDLTRVEAAYGFLARTRM